MPNPPLNLRDETVALVRLATPLAIAQFGFTALGLVDVAVLGHSTPIELGGAGIGRSIGYLALAPCIGASGALEPLASQALGAGEDGTAFRAFLGALVAAAVVWVPCAALAFAATWALVPIGIDPALVTPARAFVAGTLPGMFFVSVFLNAKTFLQAHDRTFATVVSSIVANAVNLVVCNLLVRGDEPLLWLGLPPLGLPALGALGAGIAGSIAHAVLAGGVLFAALRVRPRRAPRDTRATPLPVGKILQLGTPIGLQILAEMGVFSLVAVLAGRLGTVAVSAHQIAIGLASTTFMGALAVSGATSVRVGLAIGERRSPRAAGFLGIGVGAVYMLACGFLFLFASRWLVALFTTDPEIQLLGAELLHIAAAFQIFDGVQVVAAGALRGAADVRFPFVAMVIAHWLVGFPLALLFGFALGFGPRGLWWGLVVGLAVVSALLAWRFGRITRHAIERV